MNAESDDPSKSKDRPKKSKNEGAATEGRPRQSNVAVALIHVRKQLVLNCCNLRLDQDGTIAALSEMSLTTNGQE